MMFHTEGLRTAALAALEERLPEAGSGGEPLLVTAPWTGETLAQMSAAGPAELERAVARAREAQQAWAARPAAERAAVLRRFHDLALARRDWLLDVIQTETGKARLHAFEEVLAAALAARHYAVRAARLLAPKRRRGAVPGLTVTRELHHPLGLVGLIVPWNYPFSLAMEDALPALAAGNAVIVKPAEQTPFSALAGLALLEEAGLPAGVAQVLPGWGASLGPALVDAVDFVGFTGGSATGRQVAGRAGARGIPCSLELGGKNPMLVLADAHLDATVAGALRACFTNAGQLCIHAERLYVQRALLEPFLERFAEAASRLRVGPGYGWDVEMGSLTSAAHLEKVAGHVDQARQAGASVLCGGEARPDLGPCFYAPTVLAGVPAGTPPAGEETFGPVAAVWPFDDEDEALRLANDSPFGLNASVWSRDTRRGRALAARIRCGTVNVNDAYAPAYASLDAPMGGMKASGIGRRHGDQGLLKYTAAQTVAVQRLAPIAPPPGLAPERFAAVTSRLVGWLARIPGLR